MMLRFAVLLVLVSVCSASLKGESAPVVRSGGSECELSRVACDGMKNLCNIDAVRYEVCCETCASVALRRAMKGRNTESCELNQVACAQMKQNGLCIIQQIKDDVCCETCAQP